MSYKSALLALSLVAVAAPATAADPATTGALGVPANAIVGVWRTQAALGPCGSGVTPVQIRNILVFSAGGTLIEPIRPDAGRTDGAGIWSFNPATREYTGWLIFDRFAADGTGIGSGRVERRLLMSADGNQIAGAVRATFLAPDGSVQMELCGHAVSTRQ